MEPETVKRRTCSLLHRARREFWPQVRTLRRDKAACDESKCDKIQPVVISRLRLSLALVVKVRRKSDNRAESG